MRRALLALAAAVVASGSALSLGSAQTSPGTMPDAQTEAKQILSGQSGHFLTSNARLAVGMVARGDHQLLQIADSKLTDKKAGAARKAEGGEGPGNPAFTNVRVNNPVEDTHQTDQTTQSETAIAAVGKNVVVGFNDSQQALLLLTAGASLNGYAYSRDGGRSFTDGGAVPNLANCANLGDPWLSSDRQGAIYYSSLITCITRPGLDIAVAKSTDGGRTWATPVGVSTSLGLDFGIYFGDKPAITAGRDPSNAANDILYDSWDDFSFDFSGPFNGLPVARSTDGGATWTVNYASKLYPTPCPSPGGKGGSAPGQYIGAAPFVDPSSGTLYVAAERILFQCPPDPFTPPGPPFRSIVVFQSTDGGLTFDGGTKVSDVTQSAPPADAFDLGPGKMMRNLEFPSMALSGGKLYIAWNDGGTGRSHIELAASSDGGHSWTAQLVTTGSNDEMQPAMSADASGLHILFYRRNPDNTLDVMVSNSTDGANFSMRRVTTRSFPGVLTFPQFDPIIAPSYMGDYIANISAGGSELFAWGDNRDIVHDFMYPAGRNDPDVFFAVQASESGGGNGNG